MRPAKGIRIGSAGKKGRGVYATREFLPDDVVERAPVILIDTTHDMEWLEETLIDSYWYSGDDCQALGLGYTSLYNHSYRPNATYHLNEHTASITVVALRGILPGAEITINYNGDPKDKTKLRFNNGSYNRNGGIEAEEDVDNSRHYFDVVLDTDIWVWCGKYNVNYTDAPSLVSCKSCLHAMRAEKRRLGAWNPDAADKLNKRDTLALVNQIESGFLEGEDYSNHLVMEKLGKLLKKIPASTFPGAKKPKKRDNSG